MKKKRTGFQKVRKMEGVYKAPGFMNQEFGITYVTEQGIFQHKGNLFSRMYEIEKRTETMYEALRGYDVAFRTSHFGDKDHLMLILEAQTKEEAEKDYRKLENDMEARGMEMRHCSFEERMRMSHKFFCMGFSEKNLNVQSYAENVMAWKGDFSLKGYDFGEKWNRMVCGQEMLKAGYVRRYPMAAQSLEQAAQRLKGLLGKLEGEKEVLYITISFQPVSPQEIWMEKMRRRL